MPGEIPDAARCPYCGTVLDQAARFDSDLAAEVLRYLADIWEAEPLAVGILLLRVRHPRDTMASQCIRLGITAAAGNRLWNSLRRYSPDLAAFARGAGTKTRGRQGGRKKQRPRKVEGPR